MRRERDDDVRASFADLRPFLARGRSDPRDCGVAVAASNRAALVYRLASDAPREELALRLAERPSVDVVAWRENGSRLRAARRPPAALLARRARARMRAARAGRSRATPRRSTTRPPARSAPPPTRTRSSGSGRCSRASTPARSAPRRGPGWEFCDAGGESHLGGGSHGSLHAADSLVPCTFAGFDAGAEAPAAERSITDLAGAVRAHLGVGRA